MAPLLFIVLVGWTVFAVAGAGIAQAKGRGIGLGVAIGLGAGLASVLLGVFGLVIGIAILLVFAIIPAAQEPSRY